MSLRSGTENVPGIVGFGKACELAAKRMSEYQQHVAGLRDYLVELVLQEIPHSRLNGSRIDRIPNNAHFTFFGVNGEDLIIKLDENGRVDRIGMLGQEAKAIARAKGDEIFLRGDNGIAQAQPWDA